MNIIRGFILLLVLLLLLNGEVGAYHDPAAAGRWSYDPLKLPSSELFDPAGRPCSPQPHDSKTTPPPDPETQRETENFTFLEQESNSKMHVLFMCMCALPYVLASGPVSLH